MTTTTIETLLEQIGTSGTVEEIDNQIALLIATHAGTVPLDRELGINMEFLDQPTPLAKSLFTAQVTAAVAKFIPSVRVKEITWTHDIDGNSTPKVVITSV